MPAFNQIFGGTQDFSSLMTEEKENACIDMTGIFTRTDFIRYSLENSFAQGEREQLILKAENCIFAFEGESKTASGGKESESV